MTPDWLGPVDHLVLHVAPGGSPVEGLNRLLALVQAGTIRLLDLEVVSGDGAARSLDAGAWGDRVGVDLHAFDGLWSGLLDDEDLAAALDGAPAGGVALVVVYEVTALAPVLAAWNRPGLTLAGSGPVDETDLLAALRETPTT